MAYTMVVLSDLELDELIDWAVEQFLQGSTSVSLPALKAHQAIEVAKGIWHRTRIRIHIISDSGRTFVRDEEGRLTLEKSRRGMSSRGMKKHRKIQVLS